MTAAALRVVVESAGLDVQVRCSLFSVRVAHYATAHSLDVEPAPVLFAGEVLEVRDVRGVRVFLPVLVGL